MGKRQIRKRRTEDDDDDAEDEEAEQVLDALADAALPLARGGRDRKHGVSILDSDKDGGQHETRRAMDSTAAATDVLSQRMEEFVGSELDKTFQPHQKTEANGTENRRSEDDPAVPVHLETKPVQEVSVPGFNKAITKVALKEDVDTNGAAEGSLKRKHSGPERSSAPWIDRALFPSRFGKQKK